MNDPELRKLLEQLHNEIENAETVDEKGQELLRDLSGHIRMLLARSEQPQPFTIDGLEASIDYFEISHPTLTATLTKLMQILSSAGI
jgi:hypothetical protein